MAVRFVCLSDLHFGAANSLLSHVVDNGTVAASDRPSRTLAAFVDCIEDLLERTGPHDPKPTLVLNGDIIELALASDEVALMTFRHFARLVFSERRLFDRRVIYLPGNHDHHLWESGREQGYANYIARHDASTTLSRPWHSTPSFDAEQADAGDARRIESALLTSIIRTLPDAEDVTVELRYPVYAVDTPDHDRVVAFHHGHFTEPIYLLMSRLKAEVFPAAHERATSRTDVDLLDEVEAENFAWVDFFWSTMGRSGEVGNDIGLLYDMMGDQRALTSIARNLAMRSELLGPAWVPRPAKRLMALLALKRVARRVSRVERNSASGTDPLSSEGEACLTSFVNGPLLDRLDREGRGERKQLTMVFGHTHKPFCRRSDFDVAGTHLYNTGGWVVEKLEDDARRGAAVVVVDDDLNVAMVDIYRQGSRAPVAVSAVDADNPLAAQLRKRLDFAAAPWSALSAHVAKAVPKRHASLSRLIDEGIERAQS